MRDGISAVKSMLTEHFTSVVIYNKRLSFQTLVDLFKHHSTGSATQPAIH